MEQSQSDFDKYVERSNAQTPKRTPDRAPKVLAKKPTRVRRPYSHIFLIGFGATFFVSLAIATLIGLVPKEIANAPSENSGNSAVNNLSLESQSDTSLFGVDFTKGTPRTLKISAISNDDLPVRIVIPNAGVDTKIMNPESTDVNFLDNQLSISPVRYPGSGTIASGNIFIFGHSTGFKIVQNQAYKVFNNIKNLKEGDSISVYSLSGKIYTYKVVSVKSVKKGETWIDFSSKEPSLTLSTCELISQDGDRDVVTAIKSQ